jgi:hypothetical protein
VNQQTLSTQSRDHDSDRSPQRDKRAKLENKLRQRIAENRLSKRYFAYLTGKAGFNPQYVISSLIRDALGYKVPARLSTVDVDRLLKQHGPPDLPQRARNLSKEIEEAESNTPDFGLDQLDNERLRTEAGREQALVDLQKLPETLRLYADYFEKSRTWWRALGRITRESKEQLERVVRDRLQMEIYWRTGKHSDLRYSHLVNLARDVVGKNPIDEKALLARRRRRQKIR